MQRLRRAALLALALSLALISGAFAGDNAGATFSIGDVSKSAGVGAGETINIEIAASGLVGVKVLRVIVSASNADDFTLNTTSMSGTGALTALPGLVDADNPNVVTLGAAELDILGTSPGTNGDLTFSVNLTTSAAFSAETEATLTITQIEVGPKASEGESDVFTDLGLSVTLNPPVSDPVLSASSATDISADFSAVGSGAGSDGEVEIGVNFSDATGAAAAGQSIAFAVTNNGAESITVDGSALAAGANTTVNVSTDASGDASITLDSEGDHFAGSTSASVTATTSADNSEGTTLDLSADFSVTWDVPVPAELADFGGSMTPQSQVILAWAVPSQSNNLGWEVFRSVDNDAFERVGDLVAGEGTVNEFRTYEFTDVAVPAAEFAYYYLRQVDFDGSSHRSQTIEVALSPIQALPNATALAQNYPNPFNPETSIRFDIATEANVTVRIFDITGQVVRTLVAGTLSAGSYTELWDGRSDSGIRVGSGVYFYELKAGAFNSLKKMTLVQ
ncbi:MAG: T9SS type A sorting domain-containing protein [Gemmatimonadetes bacterium]|nr:T9SS type A sorting domain-containing protein [Gemmatimonadota bacterium]